MIRLLAPILALLGLALAEDGRGYALYASPTLLLVAGEASGHPFLARLEPGPPTRWRVEGSGRASALTHGWWAGTLDGDAVLGRLKRDGTPGDTLRFGGPLREEAVALVRAPGGRLALAGNAEGHAFGRNQGGQDIFLLLLQGERVVRSLTWGTDDDDVLTALSPAPDGGLYLAGYQMTAEDCIRVSERGFVLRADPSGRIEWIHRFSFEASSRPTALAADAGGVWVAGNTDGPLFGTARGGDDIFLLRLDARGRAQSAAQWGSDRTDLARALLATDEGLLLLGETAGTLFEATQGFTPFLALLDPEGRPRFGRTLKGETPEHAVALARRHRTLWVLTNTPASYRLRALPWPIR